MSLKFRWAGPEDSEDIETFNLVRYGPESPQAVPGRYRWLFRNNPGGLHVCLCHDGPDLVAVCGHLPVNLRVGQVSLKAAYGVDFMVEPMYRHQGIGSHFMKMRLDRFTVGLSSGQSPAMAALYDKLGAIHLATYIKGLYVRKLWPQRGLRKLMQETAAWTLGRIHSTDCGVREPIGLAEACTWVEEKEETIAPTGAGILFDAADFRWRFDGPVYRDYLCSLVREKGGAEGLLVSRFDGETEVLVTLLCPGTQRTSLLRAAAENSPAVRTAIICAGQGFHSDLRKVGFLVRRVSASAVAMTRDLGIESRLRSCIWQATGGDADSDLLRRPNPAREGSGG